MMSHTEWRVPCREGKTRPKSHHHHYYHSLRNVPGMIMTEITILIKGTISRNTNLLPWRRSVIWNQKIYKKKQKPNLWAILDELTSWKENQYLSGFFFFYFPSKSLKIKNDSNLNWNPSDLLPPKKTLIKIKLINNGVVKERKKS